MSKAEQNETPQRTEDEWVELTEALAHVRKKRDQLDAQNLRVTDNLRRTIEERDKALANAESLRVEYLKYKEAANTNSDNAAALREQLRQMTVETDAARKVADDLQVVLGQWQVAHDAAKEELARVKEEVDMFVQENTSLRDTVCQLRAKQVDDDLPGLLKAIQLAAEQARGLI
jgi:uncharacterized coiled-coil DUF342 family protein